MEPGQNQLIDKLVHGYPSHGYVIDYDELTEMGFEVHMFPDAELVVVHELRHIIAQNIVQLVRPTETVKTKGYRTGVSRILSQVPQIWEVAGVGREAGDRISLRTLVEEQLPATRVFVDRLYQEFADSGSRSKIDRLVQDRTQDPWPLGDSDPR